MLNSSRKPSDTVRFERTRITSSAYQAPKNERQLIGVGAGSYKKLAVPARKFGSPVKVNCPYWLSASSSLDWNGWNQTPNAKLMASLGTAQHRP